MSWFDASSCPSSFEEELEASNQDTGDEMICAMPPPLILPYGGTGGNWSRFRTLGFARFTHQPPLHWPTMDKCWSKGHFFQQAVLQSMRCEKLVMSFRGRCCASSVVARVVPKEFLQRNQAASSHLVSSWKGLWGKLSWWFWDLSNLVNGSKKELTLHWTAGWNSSFQNALNWKCVVGLGSVDIKNWRDICGGRYLWQDAGCESRYTSRWEWKSGGALCSWKHKSGDRKPR